MTRKTKTVLFVSIGIIVLIIIALALFIKIYLSPERVKAFLVPEAEKALHRKVSIGAIDISLFQGIEVNDFVIRERDGKTVFVSCEAFVIRYKLLPLLSKKVVVDEIQLVSPTVRIERSRDGAFNFEGIAKKAKKEGVEKEQTEEAPEGLPVSLLISKVVIKNAQFSFVDRTKELPDLKGSLAADLGIKSSDANVLSSQGDIILKLEEVVVRKPSRKSYKNIAAVLTYGVTIDQRAQDISIERADFRVQEIPLSISGKVTQFQVSPTIDLAFSLPETKLKDLQDALHTFSDIKGLKLSGSLSAEVTVAGMPQQIESLTMDGTVRLEKTGITYDSMNAVLDGMVVFNKQSVDIDVKSTVGKNRAQLKGSIKDYLKERKRINLNLYSKELYLDEVVPAGTDKEAPEPRKGKRLPKKAPQEAQPLDLKMTAGGEVKIDSAHYRNMTLKDFSLRYQLKNNIFKITRMTASAGKGKISAKSSVNLSRPGYRYTLSGMIDSLPAEEVVNSFFPRAKDTLFGILTVNLNLKGAGTVPKSIKRNLVGNGNFQLKEGKITNSPLAEKLAFFLGIEELRTIDIRQAKGTVKIGKGVAGINTVFSSDHIALDPSGTIGLDETLRLAFDLKLSPQLTDKALKNASIATYIKDEKGWGRIPLKIAGTFSKPSYSIDIEKAGKRVIKKKTQELIEDLLDTDKRKEGEEGKQKDLKPVEDLLKGIFK